MIDWNIDFFCRSSVEMQAKMLYIFVSYVVIIMRIAL